MSDLAQQIAALGDDRLAGRKLPFKPADYVPALVVVSLVPVQERDDTARVEENGA